ncbi:hypothetical protein J4E86_007068 [Alternaria arbusti]|uniref:uncharacterized protein n=1 Tax=Alternaria arbusti TaxID=232088 RepID=UPI00221FB8F4|nr:uncharacterized protein J4E86_007068 [Alternaria arbusti]KAI4951652.1 hypothetical protein J4E86_007068 [Alternaria arbusti]
MIPIASVIFNLILLTPALVLFDLALLTPTAVLISNLVLPTPPFIFISTLPNPLFARPNLSSSPPPSSTHDAKTKAARDDHVTAKAVEDT